MKRSNLFYLLLFVATVVLGSAAYSRYGMPGLVTFAGAFGTLAIYSILYKENPVFRLVEHVYLGLAAGYVVVAAVNLQLVPDYFMKIKDGYWMWGFVIPVGMLAYFTNHKQMGWMSRTPILVMGGFLAGLVFQAFSNKYLPQLKASMVSLQPTVMTLSTDNPAELSISGAINNAIFLITLCSAIIYFLFSFEQKNKGIQSTARVGRLLIMVAFGAIFGSTVMTRFAFFVDRMYFLLFEWLRIPN